jgi:hypothetical protein
MPISRQPRPGFLNPTPMNVPGGKPVAKLPQAGKAVGGAMKKPMVTKSKETPRGLATKAKQPMIPMQKSRRGY